MSSSVGKNRIYFYDEVVSSCEGDPCSSTKRRMAHADDQNIWHLKPTRQENGPGRLGPLREESVIMTESDSEIIK
jgi:hypothetical protein